MKAKLALKLEQIARLRLFSGMTDASVAQLIGLTQSGLSRIIALPEFQDIERRLAAGHIQELDVALAGRTREMRDAFAPAVPAAMRALTDAVLQRKDLKAAVSAAVQILDRDPNGTFSSASKAAGPATSLPTSVLTEAAKTASTVKVPAGSVVMPPDKNVN